MWKPKPKVPFPRVKVTWVDTECNPIWVDATAVPDLLAGLEACPCETMGFLVHEDAQFVAVAASVTWERDAGVWQFAGVTAIPAGMVRKVRKYGK